MKVLYSFPLALGSPGIGTIAAAQVRGLVDLGVEVHLFTTSTALRVSGVRTATETMVLGGKRVPHRALGVDRSYRYHDWRVARALRSIPGIELVHAWPLGSRQTFEEARRIGAVAAREVPNSHTAEAYVRAGAEARAVGLRMPPGHSHSPSSSRLTRELAEYRLADVLLTPSRFVEGTFLDRGFPKQKLARHQYGFDPERFPPPDGRRPPHRPLTAAFVGRGEPRKGLHLALRAWIDSGAADRGRLVVCGQYVPGYRGVLAPLLSHPSVEEIGFVDDIGAILRDSDVLLLPSVEEGSALVTYEAQASGCVLLVSDATGALCPHPEQALVHKAGDVGELARHLALIDRDRDLLARLRANTLAQRDKLTWATAAQRLVDIYSERIGTMTHSRRASDPSTAPGPG